MATKKEPVAIIGIGCRLPGGVNSPSDFINFLDRKGDGVCEVPQERFSLDRFQDNDPSAPGRLYPRSAGFITSQSPYEFDLAGFGISPREAEVLDPQQRWLLEVTFEALEDAGITLNEIAGTKTMVVVGGFILDQMVRTGTSESFHLINTHTAFGVTMTTLSSRLSHTFDLRGACFTVDTACSSSLVALHEACRALAAEECDRAVVAGVNTITDPTFTTVMSKGKFLSRDGRSKAFDASADGYGRGEGAGVVVLENMNYAIANNRRIHALIRGTAVNHGGHTTGMALPREEAQRELMLDACRTSGVDPSHIGYVEAHGTGTRVGDPVEAKAIGTVYGTANSNNEETTRQPVLIGSVKTNVGHTEAASGVVGLIKSALTVREKRIFPQLSFTSLNTEIPFEALNLRVALEGEAWPATDNEAMAAVNSFGYGGTNAHAIVSEPPRTSYINDETNHGYYLLQLSAFDEAALCARAKQLIPFADKSIPVLTANLRRRSELPIRACAVVSSSDDVHQVLKAISQNIPHADVAVGKTQSNAEGKFAWCFTGMGPQWVDMGRELLAKEPTFTKSFHQIDKLFVELFGWSPLAEFTSENIAERIKRNDVAQPLNFVLQVGLVEVLRELGSVPDVIIGHSVGEVAAAWAAGCLTLRDAVVVMWHRSRLQQRVAGLGGMTAVGLGVEEAKSTLELDNHPDVQIAAINANNSVTLAGKKEALAKIEEQAAGKNIFYRRLMVEVAYHSAQMDPLHEDFLTALSTITPKPPQIPLLSTVTGDWVTASGDVGVHNAEYWWKNARQPVLLMAATQTALSNGVKMFLEIGPHPVLAPAIRATAGTTGHSIVTAACLQRKAPERRSIMHALATLWCGGAAVKPIKIHTQVLDLPPYPWQRQRYWLESVSNSQRRCGIADHPLLDLKHEVPHLEWHTQLAGQQLEFLHDHVVDNEPIMPAAAFLDTALAVARYQHNQNNPTTSTTQTVQQLCLLDVHFLKALKLDVGATMLVTANNANNANLVQFHARRGEGDWMLHATATLATTHKYGNLNTPPPIADGAHPLSIETLYKQFLDRGLEFGDNFRAIKSIYHTDNKAWVEIGVPSLLSNSWIIHPVILDATFQAVLSLMPVTSSNNRPVLPVKVDRIRFLRGVSATKPVVSAYIAQTGPLKADIVLYDSEGPFAEVIGLQCVQLASTTSVDPRWLYCEQWTPVEKPGTISTSTIAQWSTTESEHVDQLLSSLRSRLQENEFPLIVITQSARSIVEGDVVQPSQRALWGLIRAARTEQPGRLLLLVDLPASPSSDDVACVNSLPFSENYSELTSDEFAIRGGHLLSARIEHTKKLYTAPASIPAFKTNSKDYAFELVQDHPGQLSALSFRGATRSVPKQGEVEIGVQYVGLNFKDLMKAMGMLSRTATETSFTGSTFGLECSGIITAVGPGSQYNVGEKVFCSWMRRSFSSHAIASEKFVRKLPAWMSLEQSACLFGYVTAWYALMETARLSKGQHVLIHSATGGVGLAALHIAKLKGAIAHVTAGTVEKRAWLTELSKTYTNIASIHNSRTLDFVSEVRAATAEHKRAGVDVVLNSLAGAAMEASLNLLATGGKFIEIGKQDITANNSLPLLAFNKSLMFVGLDIDQLAAVNSDWYAPVLDSILSEMEAGNLPPLPVTAFDGSNLEEAFRYMAAAKHIGRIAVKLSDENVQVTPRCPICTDRSYLVTGGVRGFGFAVAERLVQLGARHLWLVGRGGQGGIQFVAPEQEQKINKMRESGISVHVVGCDVSCEADVVNLVAKVHPPLAGIFHAAAHMDDEVLATQPQANFQRVVGVKAGGALNLHRASLHLDIHHFVMFSSVATVLGNPAQGAYASANALLDGIVEMRCATGKRALSVAWGAIGDVGMVASDMNTRRHLRTLGLEVIPVNCALAALEDALENDVQGCIGIMDVNWNRWVKAVPIATWARVSALCEQASNSATQQRDPAAYAEAVTRAVERVLRIKPDPETPLRDYGLDSIVAVELAAAIEAEAAIPTTTIQLLSGASVNSLVQLVIANPVTSATPEQQLENELPKQAVLPPTTKPQPINDLREWVLDNICVQPPYFDITNIEELFNNNGTSNTATHLRATIPQGAVSSSEDGEVSIAEIGRHLAILGSAAVRRRLHFGDGGKRVVGRVYFPVMQSWLISATIPKRQKDIPQQSNTTYTAIAKCTNIDTLKAQASAEGTVTTINGEHIATFGITYHVIPAADFEKLFVAHAKPTPPCSQANIYNEWEKLHTIVEDRVVRASIGPISADQCPGHFVGYPAFPVSVLLRSAIDMVAAGTGQSVTLTGGTLKTHRFAWAGEILNLMAVKKGESKNSQNWMVEGRVNDGLVVQFEFIVLS